MADLDGGLECDKSDKSPDAYKFYVNALYVAMTRAVKSLVLIEAEPGHPLLALLAVGQAGDSVELAAKESSAERIRGVLAGRLGVAPREGRETGLAPRM